MEVGNEISQKIRSAIKAKLVDLGAYVDDELPDYIMVMVANKKSHSHMTEDLSLFLGNNTQKFTEWLHSLLQKLKSITVEQTKAAAKGEVKDVPSAKDTVQQAAEEVDREAAERKSQEEGDEEELLQNLIEDVQQGEQQQQDQTDTSIIESRQDDEITLQPDTDEFADEDKNTSLTGTKSQVEPAQPLVKQKIVASHAKESVIKVLAQSGHTVTQSEDVSQSSQEYSHKVKDKHHRSSHRVSSSSSHSERSSKESRESRKRKIPGSVIGSVIHRSDDEEDEEYDPHKPMYGRVASTVKVGKRRPTVPPAKQANKTLLLKAVSDAQTSIEKSSIRSKSSNHGAHSSDKRSDIHSRLGSVSDVRSRLSRQHSPRRHDQSKRSKLSSSYSAMRSDTLEERRTVQVTPRYEPENSEPQEEEQDDVKSDASTYGSEQDNRLFETRSDNGSEENGELRTVITKDSQGNDKDVPVLEMLIQSGAEDSDFTDDERLDMAGERKVQEPVHERAASPKFVVSLDGIDPDVMEQYEDRMDDDEEGDTVIAGANLVTHHNLIDMEDEAALRARNIVRVRPMQMSSIDPDQEEVGGKRQKLMERCKFWPSCRSGDECPFHHPVTPCKAFPNCTFGDKCNYIHPHCKFDALCTRPDCMFIHSSKKQPVTTPPIILQPISMVAMPRGPRPTRPVLSAGNPFGGVRPASGNPFGGLRPRMPGGAPGGRMSCRFFPNCTNMECPFYHPKPCRFGLSCRNRLTGCAFTHPELPTKDKLKWRASSNKAQVGHEEVTSNTSLDDTMESVIDSVTADSTEPLNQMDDDDEEESININL